MKKLPWIINPFRDKADYEEYRSVVENSRAFIGGVGLLGFYPMRWLCRVFVWGATIGLTVAIVATYVH